MAKTNRFVVSLNLRSFDCLPDGVVEHCMTLRSCSALRTGEAMEAHGVDNLAHQTQVWVACPGPKSLCDGYSDLFVSEFETYGSNRSSMKPIAEVVV